MCPQSTARHRAGRSHIQARAEDFGGGLKFPGGMNFRGVCPRKGVDMPTPPGKPRSRHRAGRPYRRAKAEMHKHFGYVCIHCGHGGAGEADHLTPVALDPDQPVDWRTMRPSHGSNYPCRQCTGRDGKPRCCNQERGTKPIESIFKPALNW